MEFLDIASLGASYRYIVKIEKKLRKRGKSLDLQTPHIWNRETMGPTKKTRDNENMASQDY
jgi:hypothetical protein